MTCSSPIGIYPWSGNGRKNPNANAHIQMLRYIVITSACGLTRKRELLPHPHPHLLLPRLRLLLPAPRFGTLQRYRKRGRCKVSGGQVDGVGSCRLEFFFFCPGLHLGQQSFQSHLPTRKLEKVRATEEGTTLNSEGTAHRFDSPETGQSQRRTRAGFSQSPAVPAVPPAPLASPSFVRPKARRQLSPAFPNPSSRFPKRPIHHSHHSFS